MQSAGELGGEWRLGRRPALDGVRGLAILLVVACHSMPDEFVNGGSVGVTVFFGLSGFLITCLLIEEQRRTGVISLRRFYARRARRLLPALVVYLTCWVALSNFGVGPFRITLPEVLAALLYFMNWVMAAHLPVSHPMAITWSLSVEEQFYLFWPLTFLLARRWPRLPLTGAALGVVYSVAMRIACSTDAADFTSIYYRTDTRMDSLLVGCIAAMTVYRARGLAHWWPRVAPASLVLLIALLVVPSDPLRYLGEPLLVAIATCCLIASALAGGSRWLTWAPLRWFGKRSYALYLWHYPLVVLAWSGLRLIPVWLALACALLAAEASWWLVERPFRSLPNARVRARLLPFPSGEAITGA